MIYHPDDRREKREQATPPNPDSPPQHANPDQRTPEQREARPDEDVKPPRDYAE